MRFDDDQNLWLGMQFQGGIAKFDKKTEKFQTWSLPPELNGDHVQINQVSPDRHHIDGKVWLQDAGTYTVLRLDVASGKFEVFEPYKIPRPNVYDVIPDSKNNGYFLVMGAEEVGRIDAKTGEIEIYKTPTPGSGPRRGMMDAQDRLWFGENRADRIGMFDTRTADVPGVGGADAGRVALRRDRRQERRSVVGRRVQRSHPAPESEDGRVHRVSAAASDQRPPRLRRQLDDAGHVLGRQQPRRVDREAGAARWRQRDRPDRRRFLAGALASLGWAAASGADRLAARSTRSGRALTQTAAKPHRIDMHHHFAPPAWVAEVKGRPLLQAANTTWTPEKSIEDMDRGGVAAAVVSITNPGLWFGDAAATRASGARVQRVRRKAGAGSPDAIRPVRGDAAAGRRRDAERDRVRLRHDQGGRRRPDDELRRHVARQRRPTGR